VNSAAAFLTILLRGKHDNTARHYRGPCFPGRATRADRNSIACQTKCPGRLLQRGWAPEERRSLAWVTGGQASIRHDDRRSRARWNVGGDHKSSIWFSTVDGARELVCADVALSGNHCELGKRPFWKLLAFADAVIESTTVCCSANVRFWHKADMPRRCVWCPLSRAKRTWPKRREVCS